MTCKVRIIKSIEEFRALKPIWNELLSKSPADNYFLRWEWLWNWWRVFATVDDELATLVLESDGKIICIAPFYTGKRLLGGICPIRRLMFLGTQPNGDGDIGSEYMDIIHKKGQEVEVADIILGYIQEKKLCDEIYFERMDAASKILVALKNEAGNRKYMTIICNKFVAPFIELPSNWEDYMNSLSASMRYKIRRERRKVNGRKDVVLKKVIKKEEVDEAFLELIKLHQSRWKKKGEKGAFSREKFILFHQRMVSELAENSQLELILLSEGSTYKAAIYNISYKNKIYFYQSGIDTENSDITYGYILHCHCIERAVQNGMREYDFLLKGKDDDYKDKFAKRFRVIQDIYIPLTTKVRYFTISTEAARSIYRRLKKIKGLLPIEWVDFKLVSAQSPLFIGTSKA